MKLAIRNTIFGGIIFCIGILASVVLCGCTSQHEEDLLLFRLWAKQIGEDAFNEAIMASSVDVPSGYPKSNPDPRSYVEVKFTNSTEYLDWLWKGVGNTEIMDSQLPQNPFCVVLDLPIYPKHKRTPDGLNWVKEDGHLVRVIEEHLVKMPFLFTRNLEINVKNGVPVCKLTTNWPFGKRGVLIQTYYGEQHFLPADEVQSYFESIPFTNAFLRP